MITSPTRGHLPIYGNKNPYAQLRAKRGQKGKQFIKFIYAIDLHTYLHDTNTLLEKFDHILNLIFEPFLPLKVRTSPLGQKFEF